MLHRKKMKILLCGMNNAQPHIADGLSHHPTAKQMWDNLSDTNSNMSCILQLEQEIYQLQKGDQTLAHNTMLM